MRASPAKVTLVLMTSLGVTMLSGLSARSQDPPSDARLLGFTVDPQAPEFGAVFDLRLRIRIAPGVVVFLPDTLAPGDASVSAGAGEWSEEAGPADSVDVQARYPVMGFLNGRVELPSLPILVRPAFAGERGGARSVEELSDAGPNGTGALRRVLIPTGAIQVAPFSEMSEAGDALTPRPPADVLGGDWSIWFFVAIGLFLAAGLTVAWLLLTRWRGTSAGANGSGGSGSRRLRALRDLDRIWGLGWLEESRFVEFYEATTGVLRQLSEQYEPEWGIALTSSELLERLRDRWGARSVEALDSAVSVAESVKFGNFRPEKEMAGGHWRTVREWIESMPED